MKVDRRRPAEDENFVYPSTVPGDRTDLGARSRSAEENRGGNGDGDGGGNGNGNGNGNGRGGATAAGPATPASRAGGVPLRRPRRRRRGP